MMEAMERVAMVQMQIFLNKTLYEEKIISYDIYMQVNELLHARLESTQNGIAAS